MSNKNIDWSNLGFGYIQTDKRYVANFKDGAWEEGGLTEDANIVLNECAGVLQYAQTVFEGLKAYRTEDGHIVTFRPDLNAERMVDSAKRLHIRADVALNRAVLFLEGPDVLPDQHQNVAVDAAALVIRHEAQLFQHLLFNSDGYAFHSHRTPLCRYIVCPSYSQFNEFGRK